MIHKTVILFLSFLLFYNCQKAQNPKSNETSEVKTMIRKPPNFLDHFIEVSADENLLVVGNLVWNLSKNVQIGSYDNSGVGGYHVDIDYGKRGAFVNGDKSVMFSGSNNFGFWNIKDKKLSFSMYGGSHDLSPNNKYLIPSGMVYMINGAGSFKNNHDLAPASAMRNIMVFDPKEGKLIKNIKTPKAEASTFDQITDIKFVDDDDLVAVLWKSGELTLLNWKTGNTLKEIALDKSKGEYIGYNPTQFSNLAIDFDGKRFSVLKDYSKLLIYDLQSFELKKEIPIPKVNFGGNIKATFLENYLCFDSGGLNFYDHDSGKLAKNFGSIHTYNFSKDNKYVSISYTAAENSDKFTEIYELDDFKLVRKIKGARALCFFPKNKNRIAYLNQDGVFISDINGEKNKLLAGFAVQSKVNEPVVGDKHNDLVYDYEPIWNEDQIYISRVRKINIFDFNRMEVTIDSNLCGGYTKVRGLAVSTDNRLVAKAYCNGGKYEIKIKDFHKSKESSLIGTGKVKEIKFTADNKHLIVLLNDPREKFVYSIFKEKKTRMWAKEMFQNKFQIFGDTLIEQRADQVGGVRFIDMKSGDELMSIPGAKRIVYSDNEQLFAIQFSKELKVFDAKNGNVKFTVPLKSKVNSYLKFLSRDSYLAYGYHNIEILNLITGEQVSTDSQEFEVLSKAQEFVLMAISSDKMSNQGVKILNFMTRKELCSIHLIGEKDFIISTPDNYYMASKKAAAESITFKAGDSYYNFDQFDLKYNRPDIVLKRLGFTSPEMVKALELAYKKRINNLGLVEENLNVDFGNVPVIDFKSHLPATTSKKRINIKIEAEDKKSYLERINVYVNDVPIYGKKGLKVAKRKRLQQSVDVILEPGRNVIEIEALNTEGSYSKQISHTITSSYETNKPDLYLISLGVSKYNTEAMNLSYADKDAQDVVNALSSNKGSFANIHVDLVVNEELTKQNLVSLKNKLKNSKVNDRVIIFIAGHGIVTEELDYYLATAKTDFQSPVSNSIPYEAIEDLIDGIPARRRLILLDACHSGEIDDENAELVKNSRSIDGEVKFRSHPKEKVVSSSLQKEEIFNMMRRWFVDLNDRSGATVLASSSGIEFSMEGEQWENGVYTYCLLKGLKEGLADTNGDNIIMVSEIQNYLSSEVPKLTNDQQKPTFRIENIAYDWQVW